LERSQHPRVETSLSFGDVFLPTSLIDRNLFAASQAGLINNLNDGMRWGLFPLFFAAAGLNVERIGILKGVYPAIWGTLQVVTGPLSDRWGREGLIAAGMWVQAVGLFAIAGLDGFGWWLLGNVLLGIGTAMIYPCLLAAVSDAADPSWRARALSVYRFWRDLGYAIGALTAGLLAAVVGFAWTITAIGVLTFLSQIIRPIIEKEKGTSKVLPVDATALCNELKSQIPRCGRESARSYHFHTGVLIGPGRSSSSAPRNRTKCRIDPSAKMRLFEARRRGYSGEPSRSLAHPRTPATVLRPWWVFRRAGR